MSIDNKALEQLNKELEQLVQKQKYSQIDKYFPETGPYSRSHYPKQMDFFEKSAFHSIMGLLGANGSGKTTVGSLFTYWHASGKYSSWYHGYRFNIGPINSWVVGLGTKQLTAIQDALFGSYLDPGTGIIPREDLLDDNGKLMITAMPGANNIIGIVYIRHYNQYGKFDGFSRIEFKTAEQGFEQFQGPNIKWIWLDEDPKDGRIIAECLARTRGTEGKTGRLLCTFTATAGWSDTYLLFMPEGNLPPHGINQNNHEIYTMILGNDQAHMTPEWKRTMHHIWEKIDPQNILARETGIAQMGAGKIYPVEEEYFVIKRKDIPDYYKRAYGLDFATSVGQTACIWVAQDPVTKIKYIYAEYKRTGVHDSMHVLAIQSKGKWIPGICDPHSGRRDGGELRAEYYRSLGLDLTDGESNPAAGIAMILNDLQNGQLKVMEDCTGLISEMRTYRWDERKPGSPAPKQDDHLLDALRYLYSKFDYLAKSSDEENDDLYERPIKQFSGRDNLTGY